MTREVAVQFGPDNNLEGVLTIPDEPEKCSTAFVLLSAGLLHKIGPNRLHPRLARRMAESGACTLRFDMQGMGDSLPTKSAGDLISQTHQSVLAAMDQISDMLGIKQFVLGGLCSGAEDSFRVGLEDNRVIGVILLDGHAYPTPRFKLHRIWYRLRRKVLHVFGFYLKRREVHGSTDEEATERFGFIELPEKEWASNALSRMINRGVKLLYVYSGSWEYFNHRAQFKKMFQDVNPNSAVTVRYYSDQDHSVTLRADQKRLIETIERWFHEMIVQS